MPSLSTPKNSVWILVSRGHERFVSETHSHDSKIVNHSSSLRMKEETPNIVCSESSKLAMSNHVQGSQDSNNVDTKGDHSRTHRETVASTIQVAPSSSKSSSGGSSNPKSTHLQPKYVYTKKEIGKEDRIWSTIPGCQTSERDSFDTRISKCDTNMVRHRDQDEREEDGAMHWDNILPFLTGRFRDKIYQEYTDKDWLQSLYLGSIKTRFESCKDETGQLRYIARSKVTQVD